MKRRHSGLGMPPLPNAWQITDSLATGGALNYATNLPSAPAESLR